MRAFFWSFLLLFSLPLLADDASTIQNSFLSSLLSSAQTLGADALENSACLLRQKAMKSVDGMTVSISADFLKLLPATRLLPGSVSAVGEIAAFYRPGSDHIKIQGFLVPSAAVGYSPSSTTKKLPGDINLGLTFGCQGHPGNYEGYFASVGVGPVNLNLGLDLTEMFTNAMVARNPEFTPKTLVDYEANLNAAKNSGWIGNNVLSNQQDDYLYAFRSRFLPGSVTHPGRPERGRITRSEVFKDLTNYSGNSLQTAATIKATYESAISRMQRNLGRNDLQENLNILSEVDSFYDQSGDFLQKTAGVTFPLNIQKSEREYTAKLLNPNPMVSGKTFSSVSWRRFYLSDSEMVAEGLGSRESAMQEALTYFADGSYLCRRENRFVTFHLEYQYRARDMRPGQTPRLSRQTEPMVYDCLTGRTLNNGAYRASLDNFGEVRRLIGAHRSLYESAVNNLKGIQGHQLVLNQTYADYRLKSKVEPRKLQIGGYHGGSALTGCNSVTVSVKDSVTQFPQLIAGAGALYGSVSSLVPTSFSAVKAAAQSGARLLGKTSASISASHYYPVGPTGEVALKDLPIWFVRILKGECGQPELARRPGNPTH